MGESFFTTNSCGTFHTPEALTRNGRYQIRPYRLESGLTFNDISILEVVRGPTRRVKTLYFVWSSHSPSNISVKGLMTMPPHYNEPELVAPYFKALNKKQKRGLRSSFFIIIQSIILPLFFIECCLSRNDVHRFLFNLLYVIY